MSHQSDLSYFWILVSPVCLLYTISQKLLRAQALEDMANILY